ncbi:hypothetical protein HanOQP8_Chr08g0293401 [Helianthus annuus]|nr:hypothetical protein HanHA89_Chr08g0305061 [Helianthus annuus]KAJ0719809.1 hypothetical protein HanLR1_Chr08g0285891 [Helianthus annuus]KAJ0723035.1 hypothetical protein HanOQP8_Chr08g0293401 [Helianthus annuus]
MVATCVWSSAESTELIFSNLTARFVDNHRVGNTPLSFRGLDPDSGYSENFRSGAGLLGCLN